MSDSPRFDEAAIAEIFRQAAEAQTEARNRARVADGLTLDELLEIGKEAGLSPEFILQAASRVGAEVEAGQRPTFMGLPIGVERQIELPGPMSDEEWERLVVDLRSTFRAKGKVRRSGNLREWYNGNLHALVEPTEKGYRLRMGTLKGSAREMMSAGVGAILFSLLGAVLLFAMGDLETKKMVALLVFAAVGGGIIGSSLLNLRAWAAERERQMDGVARRTLARMQEARQPSAASPTLTGTREPLIEIDEPADPEAATVRRMRDRS